MDWVNWLMVVGTLVAAVFAWLSWRRAGDAITRSDEANGIARDSNTISRQSQAAASDANRIAERAVGEAKRSADAAEESAKQQAAAEARALEAHDVDWVAHWSGPSFRLVPESLVDRAIHLTKVGRSGAYSVSVRFDADGDSPIGGLGDVLDSSESDLVPVSDETSRALLGYGEDVDVGDITLERAKNWLHCPVHLHLRWKSELGQPHSKVVTLDPLQPLCSGCGKPDNGHHGHHR